MRNRRYFCWLWGRTPAALTIHYSDIVNWAKDSWPVRAFGTGRRSVYKGPERGDVYIYVAFEYSDVIRLHSTMEL